MKETIARMNVCYKMIVPSNIGEDAIRRMIQNDIALRNKASKLATIVPITTVIYHDTRCSECKFECADNQKFCKDCGTKL